MYIIDVFGVTIMWFGQKKKKGLLANTQQRFSRFIGLLKGKKKLDPNELRDIKRALIEADVGLAETRVVIEHIESALAQGVDSDSACLEAVRSYLKSVFPVADVPFNGRPAVVLMVGVNGAGKTTSIAKLAAHYQTQGHKVALASGDTYRAAADEQLAHWAEVTQAAFIDRGDVKDPAAVLFDAYHQAKRLGSTLLIADTSGRMHGNQTLIDQLKKIKRVLEKPMQGVPLQIWLVLDGGLGQSNLAQAQTFHEAIGANGLIVTKLDGTARGGALFSIVRQLGLPVLFAGTGEGVSDLQPFDPEWFVDQVLAN